MRERSINRFCPDLERLEQKQPLSVTAASAGLMHPKGGLALHGGQSISADAIKPNVGFLVYRATNPSPHNNHLVLPLEGFVLVQKPQPVPGQTYNVLWLVMRNGTAQTFNANSGFNVTFPGQTQPTPILTGNQVWRPGQWFVFYVLTKKYYPLRNQVTDGFKFDLAGGRSVGIPGPSGIFLRLTYNPATFDRTLQSIVAFGQGSQGGAGYRFGMPVTSLYEFVSAKTNRKDFGGLF